VYIIVLSAVVCHQWRVTIILMCSYQTVHNSASLACTTVLFTANTATAMNAHTQAQRKARKRADKRAQSETVAAEKKKERAKALEAPSEDPKKNNKNNNNNGSSSSSMVASKKGDLDRLAAGFLAKGSAVKRKAADVRVEDFVEQQPSASKSSASSSAAAPAKKRSKKA
jgi:hypothetical protein